MLGYDEQVQLGIDASLGTKRRGLSTEAQDFYDSVAGDVEKANELGAYLAPPCDWDAREEGVDVSAVNALITAALQADEAGHAFRGNQYVTVPTELKETLVGKQLHPEQYANNADKIKSSLDKLHENDASWNSNVALMESATSRFPMIHTMRADVISSVEKDGILPANRVGKGLEFDKQTGLDKTVFMRQGQAGGGGHGAVGVMIDQNKLDPDKFVVTRLGLMTTKLQENDMLKTPGDHSALLQEQLKPFSESSIHIKDLPSVQARLLVSGYLKDHPEMAGKAIDPARVLENDHGEMEIKYVGTIPPSAVTAYFAGDKPVESLGGKSAYEYIKDSVPADKLVKYDGEGLSDLSNAYRQHYGTTDAEKAIEYRSEFVRNVNNLSRTAKGVVDTSVSPLKPKVDLAHDLIAEQEKFNTENLFQHALIHKDDDFSSPEKVKDFVERANMIANNGIEKVGFRAWPSKSGAYIAPDKIDSELDKYYSEMSKRLTDNSDPVGTAAFSEQNFSGHIHPFADGVGRTNQVISALTLMRGGKQLPKYPPLTEFASHFKDSQDEFTKYYRSLFNKVDVSAINALVTGAITAAYYDHAGRPGHRGGSSPQSSPYENVLTQEEVNKRTELTQDEAASYLQSKIDTASPSLGPLQTEQLRSSVKNGLKQFSPSALQKICSNVDKIEYAPIPSQFDKLAGEPASPQGAISFFQAQNRLLVTSLSGDKESMAHELAHAMDIHAVNGKEVRTYSGTDEWKRAWKSDYQEKAMFLPHGEYGATHPAEGFAVAFEDANELGPVISSSAPRMYDYLTAHHLLNAPTEAEEKAMRSFGLHSRDASTSEVKRREMIIDGCYVTVFGDLTDAQVKDYVEKALRKEPDAS